MMTATTTTTASRFLIVYLCIGVVALQCCNLVDSFSPPLSSTRSTSTAPLFATLTVGGGGNTLPKEANLLIQELWGSSSKTGLVNINRIATACSDDVVWEDMRLKEPVKGKNAVRELLQSQLPRGTTIVVDKVSDGVNSAGFTWTRKPSDDEGKLGLRGTTFVKLNDEGKIVSVKELAEPLYKPGDMMLKLLQAATKNAPRPEKNPTYVEETPTSCSEIVDYIWNRAYPKDAPIEESMKFYAQDIVYQDFNYPEPIVGLKDVETFSREWGDFPGIEFRIQDLSEGDVACCFTWRVTVNGQEGPQGISFYETDGQGKITYIRDTPAPSFQPILGKLARLLRPKLGTFRSRKDMVDGIPIVTKDE